MIMSLGTAAAGIGTGGRASGGLGPVARTFGYAADHVRSVEVVDGTGRRREVDAEHDPELFWALRGGKAGLGVVTALTIDLLPLRTLHAGGLYFPTEQVGQVLHTWLDWTRTLTSFCR